MRLLNTEKIALVDFSGPDLPPYAILSHTWGTGEVSFEDMTTSDPSTLAAKRGYAKILETCRLALSQGFKYVWIDTCCINKSSSAELTESINSMFNWYQRSEVCYVYLSDHIPPGLEGMETCRWFTRGWTLQELLAPTNVEFYNRDWAGIGTKKELCFRLGLITGIPVSMVAGLDALHMYSVAQRMAWAAGRKTTRPEDRAYSLLGIFDIHMPMIYGEGLNAFQRLQEEIIKRTADLTILAWKPNSQEGSFCSPLAALPDAFQTSHDIRRSPIYEMAFSTSNKGLQLVQKRLFLYPWRESREEMSIKYMLEVGRTAVKHEYVCIPLRQIGFATYVREARPSLVTFPSSQKVEIPLTMPHKFFLEAVRNSHADILDTFVGRDGFQRVLYIPMSKQITFVANSALPPAAYDHSTGLVHYPLGIGITFFACSFVASVGPKPTAFGALVGSILPSEQPRVLLVDMATAEGKLLFLLLRRNPEEPMTWEDIDTNLPEVARMNNCLRIYDGPVRFEVTGSVTQKFLPVHLKPLRLPTTDDEAHVQVHEQVHELTLELEIYELGPSGPETSSH